MAQLVTQMGMLRGFGQFAAGMTMLAAVPLWAQQLTPAQAADPTVGTPADARSVHEQSAEERTNSRTYRDVDLMRRDGFSVAPEATVSLRILDKKGVRPGNVQSGDLTLIVNGSEREGKLQAPDGTVVPPSPLVLLVFPPNQPIVHSIGIHQAEKYFSSQPNELLPWKVGILDANGKLTPFTNGRSQLMAYLDAVDHTVEPFQYWSSGSLRSSTKWNGGWLTNAEEAIALMQNYEGPKVLLAMNPLAESMYGLNDQILSHEGPESLTDIAQHIGAHIYVANVGGPDVLVPGGDAAEDRPAQVNTPGGPLLGTKPSFHMQVDPRDSAAMDYFAARTSAMMLTAKDTLGGFSNSLKDLAGYIHRDLDETYSLTFEMTARDRDIGIPNVVVRMADHNERVAILDVSPLGSLASIERLSISKEVQEQVKRSAKHPVTSPDFLISQRVDFFPLRAGLQAVLPMTCAVEWEGPGRGPQRLSVLETVEDTNLSTPVLDREVQAIWNGRSLSWERDGVLHPGRYVWRVAIHDAQGKVYASAERKVEVEFPRGAAVSSSSLVVGKSCRSTLTASALRRRGDVDPALPDQERLHVDPMMAADCRVRPEATDQFSAKESLHALVRIYPSAKLVKRTADSWTASFVLRSAAGAVETERELPFTSDSGSGYLAYVEVPLSAATIQPGVHTLEVKMRGPGIRHDITESRTISIVGTAAP